MEKWIIHLVLERSQMDLIKAILSIKIAQNKHKLTTCITKLTASTRNKISLLVFRIMIVSLLKI